MRLLIICTLSGQNRYISTRSLNTWTFRMSTSSSSFLTPTDDEVDIWNVYWYSKNVLICIDFVHSIYIWSGDALVGQKNHIFEKWDEMMKHRCTFSVDRITWPLPVTVSGFVVRTPSAGLPEHATSDESLENYDRIFDKILDRSSMNSSGSQSHPSETALQKNEYWI